ncbi:MAG: hypothetical protein ACJ789_21240 [Thermomicrobiales bacterium]
MGSQGYAARARHHLSSELGTNEDSTTCVKSALSVKSPPTEGNGVSAMREKREKPELEPRELDDIRSFIAEMPAVDQWNLDETAARILAMSDAERAVYAAALIHDWRAWRLAMEQFAEGATS